GEMVEIRSIFYEGIRTLRLARQIEHLLRMNLFMQFRMILRAVNPTSLVGRQKEALRFSETQFLRDIIKVIT
ncbi:MAG: hypothetical protein ACKN80_01730, partial [Actinomycetales bacterium]